VASPEVIYVSRLIRLSLVAADGSDVGHLVDVVIDLGGRPPRVNGFVVRVGRRSVFVGAGRVGEISGDGLRLRRGTINLRQFEPRTGERLVAGELFGRPIRNQRVVDLGLSPAPEPFAWEVHTVAVGGRGLPGRRRPPEVVDWSEAGDLFADERSIDRQAATLGGLHPAEMAAAIRNLPLSRRKRLAEALEDDRLADLLEEMPEDEQVRIVEGLDRGRLARVLDEMEADDAADLLAEFSAARQALARIRDPDLDVPLAAQVFVCQAPHETPTGRYHGVVGMQRLLREAPGKPLGRCLDEEWEPVAPDLSEGEVAARLAAYNVVALPVCDGARRLVGAVTIDDVLDRVLPANWRLARVESK
jgi:CBS domain-containing protein/sporulation protein YlmC with PRC-barrel domain